MRVQLSLGGTEGLRAVAYIALTFFAHHFQDFARLDQLAPVKNFVLGGSRPKRRESFRQIHSSSATRSN
jgi:hypothetical protein